jgi:hypothetical protein
VLWAPTVFTLTGALVVLGVVIAGLRGALRAASPDHWAERYGGETYVHFAWQVLGRGLFLGYVFTLGLSPMAAAFFSGGKGFWREFFFLTLINWAVGAIVIYLLTLTPGLLGYLGYRRDARAQGTRTGGLPVYLQVLIVVILSAPLVYILIALLLPPAREFFRIIINTAWLYAQIKL